MASVDQVLRDGHALELRVDLVLSLLGVAEVGEEHARVRADQGEAVGAGVAGQVAHVDEVGDQQQVDAGPVEGGYQAVQRVYSSGQLLFQ